MWVLVIKIKCVGITYIPYIEMIKLTTKLGENFGGKTDNKRILLINCPQLKTCQKYINKFAIDDEGFFKA